MRSHLVRSALTLNGDRDLRPDRTPDQRARDARLAIEQECGSFAPALLALIDRRMADATECETAEFIIARWRDDGDERARLVAHAMQTPGRVRAEAVIAREVQEILTPLARTKGFSAERTRDIHRELVKYLRKKLPNENISRLKTAASCAVEFREDRIAVKLEGIFALLNPSPLAS